MLNRIGAFLKASECFGAPGINITRVSCNKDVDSHTLFINTQGNEAQLKAADEQLVSIGDLQNADCGKASYWLGST